MPDVTLGDGVRVTISSPSFTVAASPPGTATVLAVPIAGPAGTGGEAGVEVQQATPLATWTIPVPGSFGRRPNVAVYVSGEQVETDVTATTTTVVVTFPSPVAGSVVLS